MTTVYVLFTGLSRYCHFEISQCKVCTFCWIGEFLRICLMK